MDKQIKVLGFKNLEPDEQAILKRIVYKDYKKLVILLNKLYGKELPNLELVIDIKKINAQGKQKNYDVKANLFATNNRFNAIANDWDFAKALHEIMDNLSNLINKKFRIQK
ncbi:MAG: hypothetical protein U9Q69_05420 [Nanoarchaeota archaeon]|nr:hypothetical protein [Nanoarchaeota archaeon]